MSIDDITREIKKRETFLITTHINPEGDAIGSALAMAIALSSIGKKVSVCTRDPVPKSLKFLPASESIRQVDSVDDRFDAVIIVDCGDLERVGFLSAGNIPGDVLINIDHHVTNRSFGDINLVQEAVAAAELVYEIIKRLGIPITSDIATCIYTSIMTETGAFRYSNATNRAFTMAGEMIESGANPWMIAEHVYGGTSLGSIKLLGRLLSDIEMSDDGRISWIVVSEEMFRKTGTTKEDAEGFVNFPRSIEGVEVAVFFRETGSGWKISLRSNGKIDVAALATEFGGGGHSMAAGFFIKGGFEEVKKKVITCIEDNLRQ